MKKKILYSVLTIISIIFILILCSNKVEATVYDSKIHYDENHDGTITVYSANTYIESVEIPEKINGKIVTTIKENGFLNCKYLKNIKLPNTIRTINNNAFKNCESLTDITIPTSVTQIGEYTFSNCNSLTNITIPASVTEIYNGAFSECTSLTTAKIQGKINSLQAEMFDGCTSLKTVSLSNTITHIGNDAFQNCTALETINIPQNIESIGSCAFYNCMNLKTITIPEKVRIIYSGTFYNCSKLTTVKMEGVTEIEEYYWGKGAFEGCSTLRTVYFSKSIAEIGDNAFKGIPASQLTIYGYAETAAKYYAQEKGYKFVECTPVTSIKITGANKVTESSKITLTATISPTNAYNKAIVWTSSNENIAKVNQTGVVTGIKSGTATITVKAKDGTEVKATYQITVTPYKLPFTDVATNAWYYNSVMFVYREGIIQGANEKQFKPSNNLTRGQLATILWRMENSPKVTYKNPFPDVKTSDYFYNAVMWAASKGIVNGYNTGVFKPNTYVTREQLAVMINNYARYKGKNIDIETNIYKYEDSAKVSSYAKDGLRWAIANKVLSGKSNGTKIDPQGTATRAEAAAMLQNYCYYVKNSTIKNIQPELLSTYNINEVNINDEIYFLSEANFTHTYIDYKYNYTQLNGTYTIKGSKITLKYSNGQIKHIIINNTTKTFEYDEKYPLSIQRNTEYSLKNANYYVGWIIFNNNNFTIMYGYPNSGAVSLRGTYKIEGSRITFKITREGDEGGEYPVNYTMIGIVSSDGKSIYTPMNDEGENWIFSI